MSDLTSYARGIAYLTIMILAMGGANCAGAESFTVDQSQTVSNLFFNLDMTSPAGQEFRPIFSSLNRIEILLEDAFVGKGPEAKFAITIYEGSLGGPDIGTSTNVTLASGFVRDVVLFDFPSVIPLAPEDLYVFGIRQLEGATYFIGASSEDLYSRGRAVLNGSPVVPGFIVQDFYFREGSTAVPELPTAFLLATGCLALFGLGSFRQYVSCARRTGCLMSTSAKSEDRLGSSRREVDHTQIRSQKIEEGHSKSGNGRRK